MTIAVNKTTEDLHRRAFVRKLRAIPNFAERVPGDLHEGVAPRETPMAFGTYDLVAAPVVDDWTKRTIRSWWDIEWTSEDQVEAGRLDRLAMNALDNQIVSIEVEDDEVEQPVDPEEDRVMVGQTILYCGRIAGLRDKEETAEGKTIYRIGGTYAIWGDQPLHAAP